MEDRPGLVRKAEEVADLILALESPRDAATVLGYVQAKLLLAAGAEHEAHARTLLADSTEGVLACWAASRGLQR